MSDGERNAFLICDHFASVTDIREQFPLDDEETQAIAEGAGIRHPVDRTSRVVLVQTTDFLIDLEQNGRSVSVARAVKPASKLREPGVVEKLELERRYWTSRNVDWGVITEKEVPLILLRNLELLRNSHDIDQLKQPHEGFFRDQLPVLIAQMDRTSSTTLRDFSTEMDARLGMEAGSALLLVHHLLATKVWDTDLMRPITDDLAMSDIQHTPTSAIGRISG